MRTKIFFVLFLLSESTYLFGQVNINDSISDNKISLTKFYTSLSPDSLNRFDKKGKKYGWHIDYLNQSWKVVKKEKSYYYVYTYYKNGKSYDPLKYYTKNGKLKQSSSKTIFKIGEPVALNGQFTCLDKDGRTQSEIQFKDAYRTGKFKIYKSGKIYMESDFDKKYNALNFSYYLTMFKKDGSTGIKGYYRYGIIYLE